MSKIPDEGRVTAWSSWDEWKHVYKLLYYFGNVQAQQKGIDMVDMWKSNIRQGTLPISIELTSSLISVYIENLNPKPSNTDQCKLASAMAVVRFVNGITDQLQTGIYAQSVQIIADKLKIPDWLVDLRHESTHSRLPGFSVLKSGVMVALTWLDNNYWKATEEKINAKERDLVQDTFANVFEYCDIILSIVTTKNKPKSTKEIKKFERKQDRCKEICFNILKSSHNGNLNQIVKTLVQEGCFIFNGKWYSSLNLSHCNINYALNNDDLVTVDELVMLWKPIFTTIQNEYPMFLNLILKELFLVFQQKIDLEIQFSVLLGIFIILKIDKTSHHSAFKFMLRNPSRFSFQILNFFISEHAFPAILLNKMRAFYDVFIDNIEFINNKTMNDRHFVCNYTTDQLELINKFKQLAKHDLEVDEKPLLRWTALSEEEFDRLPPFGKLVDNHCLYSHDGVEHVNASQEVITIIDDDINKDTKSVANNLKNIIANLFIHDYVLNVDSVDSSSSLNTDQNYQLDQNPSWEMNVDFQIYDEEYAHKTMKKEISDSILNMNQLANIDASKISFF